jgi:hypothetical protein
MPHYKTVNIPADVHARLAQWCEANGHSIVWILIQLVEGHLRGVGGGADD